MNYSIKEFADKCNVTKRTLQYYDSIGLLKPAFKQNNTRFYTDHEYQLMQQIQFYKNIGLTLDEIKHLNNYSLNSHKSTNILKQKIAEIDHQITSNNDALNKIDFLLNNNSNFINITDSIFETTNKHKQISNLFYQPFHYWLKYFLIALNIIIYISLLIIIFNLLFL